MSNQPAIVATENNVNVEEQQPQRKGSRSFKVKLEENGVQYGRYNGDSPYQAANKALSEIIRNKVKKGEQVDLDLEFFLVESTKGSEKKIHKYSGKRIKLTEPVHYKVGNGQEITKNYKNVLRKIKKSQMIGGAQEPIVQPPVQLPITPVTPATTAAPSS